MSYKINPTIHYRGSAILLLSPDCPLPNESFAVNYVIRKNDDGRITFSANKLSHEQIVSSSTIPSLFSPIGNGNIIFFADKKEFIVKGDCEIDVADILRQAYPKIRVNDLSVNDISLALFTSLK